MFRRADFHHFLFDQRGGGAGLHAGAAGDAFAGHERFVLAGGDAGGEAAAIDGEREGALHFLAGAHAAAAHDAFGGVVVEVRVGLVLFGMDVVGAGIAVAHITQANLAGRILQFAIAIGAAGEAIERVIGDIELHHPFAEFAQPFIAGDNRHAGGHQRGAACRRAGAAFDFHQAEPAGPEGVQRVGGAELGHLDADFGGRAHQRGAFRHGHIKPVDLQRDELVSLAGGRAEIRFLNECHLGSP